jgi:putative transcriptional regulator
VNCDELQQLTAIRALGVLSGDELAVLEKHLAEDADARLEMARFFDTAAALVAVVPQKAPPAALRGRILDRIRQTPQLKAGQTPAAPPTPDPFSFINCDAPWLPTPMQGVRLKVLSASASQTYAMLLVELAPGTVYPEHEHEGTEETYVLTGDLTTEGRVLGPGDYFHAEPGTHHQPLSTENGCTAIFIIPRQAFLEFQRQG